MPVHAPMLFESVSVGCIGKVAGTPELVKAA